VREDRSFVPIAPAPSWPYFLRFSIILWLININIDVIYRFWHLEHSPLIDNAEDFEYYIFCHRSFEPRQFKKKISVVLILHNNMIFFVILTRIIPTILRSVFQLIPPYPWFLLCYIYKCLEFSTFFSVDLCDNAESQPDYCLRYLGSVVDTEQHGSWNFNNVTWTLVGHSSILSITS
jgi:hypothetical protein